MSLATPLLQLNVAFYTTLGLFDTGIAFFTNGVKRSQTTVISWLGSDDSQFCALCYSPRLDQALLVTLLLKHRFSKVLAESSENRLAVNKKKGCKKSKCSKWKGGTCRCGR